MGKKSKRKRLNESSMSSAPSTPQNNLTYSAIHNANQTLYGPPPNIPIISSPCTVQPFHSLQPAMQNVYTSTPIHNNVLQSNTPSTFQGQGYGQPNMSTNDPMNQIYPPNTHNLPMILQDIQTKLQKLDLLDNVCERLSAIERKFDIVDQDIAQLKQTKHNQNKKIGDVENDMRHFHNRISELECSRRDLEMRTYELNETILDGKTRSMKYNVIFENIVETFNPDPSIKEDTETILRTFIKEELNIEDEVKFHNVHRLRKRVDRKPRGIVARFVYYKDKERVLRAAQTLLNDKPQRVYSQYPQEISDRRKELVPIMKQFRDEGRRANIVVDKLYVDGQRYIPNHNTDINDGDRRERSHTGANRQVRFF